MHTLTNYITLLKIPIGQVSITLPQPLKLWQHIDLRVEVAWNETPQENSALLIEFMPRQIN